MLIAINQDSTYPHLHASTHAEKNLNFSERHARCMLTRGSGRRPAPQPEGSALGSPCAHSRGRVSLSGRPPPWPLIRPPWGPTWGRASEQSACRDSTSPGAFLFPSAGWPGSEQSRGVPASPRSWQSFQPRGLLCTLSVGASHTVRSEGLALFLFHGSSMFWGVF